MPSDDTNNDTDSIDSEFRRASDLPQSGPETACLMGHLGCSGPAGELGSCPDCRRYAEVVGR